MSSIAEKIAALGPQVAAFVARGRKPRPLSPDEKRLAVADPKAFDALVLKLQADTLDDLRAEAAFGVLEEDLATEQSAERAKQAAQMDAERQEFLALRHEQALQIDAALQDLNASLVIFQDLSAKVSSIDRQLGETDRHRASFGLTALGLKRAVRNYAPALWKLLGNGLTGQGTNNSLSDMTKPDGYDLTVRMGEVDPLDI